LEGDGLADLVCPGAPGDPLRLFLSAPGRALTPRDLPVPQGASLFGSVLFDADNDGDLDLFVAGSVLLLYLNDGTGRLQDATAATGLSAIAVPDAAGVAAADIRGEAGHS